MASELRVTTIANNAGTESVDTTYVVNGSAKGWCSFDGGSATLSFHDSFNGSSLTDNDIGNYTMNLSINMSNVYFPSSFAINARNQTGVPGSSQPSTSECKVRCTNISDSNNDNSFVQIIVHGDLA